MAVTVTLGPRPGRVRAALSALPLSVLVVVVVLGAAAGVFGLVSLLAAGLAEIGERATVGTLAMAGRARSWRPGWANHRDVTDWADAWHRANTTTPTTTPRATATVATAGPAVTTVTVGMGGVR